MTKNHDIFRDSFSIFLDYISRKLKSDPDYEFHPLIKAFINALEAVKKVKTGENVIGLSGESEKDKFFNPYIVVLTKTPIGIEVKEIEELTTKRKLPLDVMVSIFRLQIQLDKFPGKNISSEQSTEILNYILPEYHFYSLGDKWVEARDLFAKKLKDGKISIPSTMMTDDLVNEFTSIRYDTPWSEYPARVRSMIAGMSGEIFDSRGNTIIMSTPPKTEVPKYKIFEFVSQILMGAGAKYLGGENCIFCKRKNVEECVVSIEENFVILSDKFPLCEGHLLVVSKKHVRAIGDLKLEELLELEEIIGKISNFYGSTKSKFVMFEPGSLGQSVYHAHIHFLPGEFHIQEAMKTYKMPTEEIGSLTEITEKYKKHGSYFLWMEDGKTFISFPDSSISTKSFFRSLVSSQMLRGDLVDWTKLSSNKEYMLKVSQQIKTVKEKWNKFI